MRKRIGSALALSALVTLAACGGGNVFGATRLTGGAGSGSGTGSIAGQVQSGGSGLGGVVVVLGNADSTITSTSGTFRFDSLTAATYTLGVRVPLGFAPAAGETGLRSITIPSSGGTVNTSFSLQQTSTVGF